MVKVVVVGMDSSAVHHSPRVQMQIQDKSRIPQALSPCTMASHHGNHHHNPGLCARHRDRTHHSREASQKNRLPPGARSLSLSERYEVEVSTRCIGNRPPLLSACMFISLITIASSASCKRLEPEPSGVTQPFCLSIPRH
jgi:hypothetical protein